jgi:hypothetical protein
MTEEKKPFTVSDRRHFTAEGEARQQVADEPAAPTEKEGATERPATQQRASDSFASERPGEERERARGGESGTAPPRVDERSEGFTPERAEDAPPMDFIGLLVSLATQAGYLMSPEPGSGAAADLAGARAVIGLLEILKDKTEGRRTEDEERVLDGLLYELRMAFVARTRAEKA